MYRIIGKRELQARFEESLRQYPPLERQSRRKTASLSDLRFAAVGIVLRERAGAIEDFLLTFRAPTLNKHAAQVALPGGLLEVDEQSDPLRGLEREIEEEVGIAQGTIEWLVNPFDRVVSLHGIQVAPYIGFLKDSACEQRLRTNVQEVEVAEWIAFRQLFDENLWESRLYGPGQEPMPVWKGWRYETWGLTAIILTVFIRRISGHAPY